MVRYLTLISFTDQGVRNVGNSIQRATSFGKVVEEAGGKLISQYWAIGEFDGSVVFEAPDEEAGAALLLKLARDGNVRTNTMRVYNTPEFQKTLSGS